MKRAAMTAVLVATTAMAGCGSTASAPPPAMDASPYTPTCDAGEMLVTHPAPQLPTCAPVGADANMDAGTDGQAN